MTSSADDSQVPPKVQAASSEDSNDANVDSSKSDSSQKILIGSQKGNETEQLVPKPAPIDKKQMNLDEIGKKLSGSAKRRKQSAPPQMPSENRPGKILLQELAQEVDHDLKEIEEQGSFPPPRVTRISDDLQEEIDEALSDISMNDLLDQKVQNDLELESRHQAAVIKIDGELVFFSIGGQNEGFASLRNLSEDKYPEIGDRLDVIISRYNAEEGLYELALPGASVSVEDWSDLTVGATVEAKITGHNKGGLECLVNQVRGFIPASHVSLYHVENLAEFVDQKLLCQVSEVSPERRNLVLSRRSILEKEQEANRKKLLESLEIGGIYEGVVRKLENFGAFVDLGGVDGLVHVSKLSWDRIKHPSEVVEVGQKIKVKLDKIDRQTGKISLTFRDHLVNPWENITQKYVVSSIVSGTVSKLMEFGAFVKLEPGVEGLIHISELAHHRVLRASNVVKEGQEVDVKVLSVDPDNQRISLSLKATQAAPEKAKTKEELLQEEEENAPPRQAAVPKRDQPLKGGLGRKGSEGDKFGLKW